MKIKLERKLTSCPRSLRCKVCSQIFEVGKLRNLLYTDRGLLMGDVCPQCFRKEAHEIQHLLKQQGNWMMEPRKGVGAQTRCFADTARVATYRHALELVELAAEPVEFPVLYQLWLKRIEIFMEENQEAESARFQRSNWVGMQRSRLEKVFERNVD
jgi:hypothetical protein